MTSQKEVLRSKMSVASVNYDDDREASRNKREAATYNTEIEREVETPSRVFKNNGDTW